MSNNNCKHGFIGDGCQFKQGEMILVSGFDEIETANKMKFIVFWGGYYWCADEIDNLCKWKYAWPLPEKKWQPFKDSEETRDFLRGKWVRSKGKKRDFCITCIDRDGIFLLDDFILFEQLFEEFEILIDGQWQPCGVEVVR